MTPFEKIKLSSVDWPFVINNHHRARSYNIRHVMCGDLVNRLFVPDKAANGSLPYREQVNRRFSIDGLSNRIWKRLNPDSSEPQGTAWR
jgi:hypothetical protein